MNENSPFFPEITPFATHNIPVGDGHTLYVAQYGNPSGIPVVCLHGGPGSGFGDKTPRRFNPNTYHIICFDQRGAGRSTPTGSLTANTTTHLIQDIETLRTYLNISAWAVYGASWGSTLALAYAQTHPEHVLALTLSGILLGTQAELDWFNLPSGLPQFRWQAYQNLLSVLPDNILAQKSLDKALLEILQGKDAALARAAARAYCIYESSACDPAPDMPAIEAYADAEPNLINSITIELHYFTNNFFLTPNQLLNNYARISHLPTFIVQGGLDFVCPPANAQKLHAVLPRSTYIEVPLGGHYTGEPLEKARIQATEAMAQAILA